ncbi:MAG: hypothetical protein KIT40_16295 [Nitrospira sp.]|nr:hypothetical protein [Nitrospira sp.]
MHPNHPMVVHFPIALLLAGLFFDLVALRWRGKECRATSLSLLPLGGWTALVALLPGHLAEDAVAQGGTIPSRRSRRMRNRHLPPLGCMLSSSCSSA